MTFPMNGPHERYFADPDRRPSNQRTDPVLAHTQWRVRELAEWLDGGNVVVEAEALLQNHAPRPRRCDPGE